MVLSERQLSRILVPSTNGNTSTVIFSLTAHLLSAPSWLRAQNIGKNVGFNLFDEKNNCGE